ncbi:MAG: tRNA (adenosine(37)-N6)-threonylcarbamoyltransferase complex ATPase subunit type 1 TsaE [Deltaproteobacteria bacterium]|nr:tRNA (adenosine(37)-N6)-threonylcarbamoyltransferase complex ATPase subunit type 1 TsaE [Deltaproteobacteria bacterium]
MNRVPLLVTVISRNSEDTFSIGRIIGESLNAGDIVALSGDLGTGKTYLTKGIARGLGVSEQYQITSPTYTLINEYPGRLTLYHFDLYRLDTFLDMINLGYEEYLFGKGVSVIEWAEKASDILPDETIFISLTYLDENRRKMVISGNDERLLIISNAFKNGGY